MFLSKGKNGRIGRHVRSMGELAIVEEAVTALPYRGATVSELTIIADDAANKAEEAKKRHLAHAKKLEKIAAAKAEEARVRQGQAEVMRIQAVKRKQQEKENAKWHKHFARVAGKSETEAVIQSLSADFSRDEIVEDRRPLRPMSRRANFDQLRLVGNPLTRDATLFGPANDWDRFLPGTEMDNDFVPALEVVGGTMLGRMSGNDIPLTKRTLRKTQTVGDFWGDLSTKFQEEILKQAPGAIIQSEIQKQLNYSQPTPQPQTVIVQQPSPAPTAPVSYTTSAAKSLGVPPAVLYAVGGIAVLGIGLIAYKALSKKGTPA